MKYTYTEKAFVKRLIPVLAKLEIDRNINMCELHMILFFETGLRLLDHGANADLILKDIKKAFKKLK